MAIAANEVSARIICVDPGHGGSDLGAAPPGCYEKTANLNVGLALDYLLNSDFAYASALTRSTDVFVDLQARIDIGLCLLPPYMPCQTFVSLHHSAGVTNGSQTEVEYDSDNSQASGVYQDSELLAQQLVSDLCGRFSSTYGIPCHGVCHDTDPSPCSNEHVYVLTWNTLPAALGEPLGMWTDAHAGDLCYPTTYRTSFDEANAYYWGICHAYGTTAVGTSFAAAAVGSQQIQLTWEESDPERNVAYVIATSDQCWGPFDRAAVIVYSHDPTYTSDNIHYAATIPAPYSRTYWCRLTTLDESKVLSVVPNGGVGPNGVGAPIGVGGSGMDLNGTMGLVNLSWTAGSGTATRYDVWRSEYDGMTTCSDRMQYLGSVGSTAFADSAAPVGVPLYYRVRAENSQTGSSISAQTSVNIARVVDVAKGPPAVETGLWVGPNPARGNVRLGYTLARAGRVKVGVYDVAGRLIYVAYDGWASAGEHNLLWESGHGASHGGNVYFVRMSVDHEPAIRARVVVLN